MVDQDNLTSWGLLTDCFLLSATSCWKASVSSLSPVEISLGREGASNFALTSDLALLGRVLAPPEAFERFAAPGSRWPVRNADDTMVASAIQGSATVPTNACFVEFGARHCKNLNPTDDCCSSCCVVSAVLLSS